LARVDGGAGLAFVVGERQGPADAQQLEVGFQALPQGGQTAEQLELLAVGQVR